MKVLEPWITLTYSSAIVVQFCLFFSNKYENECKIIYSDYTSESLHFSEHLIWKHLFVGFIFHNRFVYIYIYLCTQFLENIVGYILLLYKVLQRMLKSA